MSVGTYLDSLASQLVLSADEKASIGTSISALQVRLNAHFGSALKEHFQFGSSTRGTILPRKADSNSDVDYMVVFETATEGKKKPQTYLDRLRRFAELKYATSEVSQSHPTVILSLNHIRFELVPAVYEYGYYIPSPASSWVEWLATDPSGTTKALEDKNKAHSSQIKPLVRLAKYWNACKGHPFTSYSLETRIVGGSFWGCTSLRDHFYSFWASFSCPYDLSETVKAMVDAAKAHAEKAAKHEADGMPLSAEIEVKKIVPEL